MSGYNNYPQPNQEKLDVAGFLNQFSTSNCASLDQQNNPVCISRQTQCINTCIQPIISNDSLNISAKGLEAYQKCVDPCFWNDKDICKSPYASESVKCGGADPNSSNNNNNSGGDPNSTGMLF